MAIPLKFNKNDEWYTPRYAVNPILEFIPKGAVVWCPFDTEQSEFVKAFKERGNEVYYTHIANDGDFFKIPVPPCDYIVSNPPYSKKTEVLKYLFEIGKPFAMLLNLQGIFDSKERAKLFSENPFELLILSPRVQYHSDGGGNTYQPPFQSSYLCSQLYQHK